MGSRRDIDLREFVRVRSAGLLRTLRATGPARRSRVVAPVAVLAILLAAVGCSTGPEPNTVISPSVAPTAAETVQPATLDQLPLGEPVGIPYVTGRTIVLAPDLSVELPDGVFEPEWDGMVGTKDGLLVIPADLSYDRVKPLHVGRNGTMVEVDTEPGLGSYGGHALAPDRRYVAWIKGGWFDRPAIARITDLKTGEVVASRALPDSSVTLGNFPDLPTIAAFDGDRVLLVHDNASYELWNPANGKLEAGPDPGELDSIWAGSVAGDALLGTARDDTSHDCLVNVSIANPGRERWRICDVDALPFPSLDGRYLALPRFGGDGPHHEVRIDVRDLETGDVVVRHNVTVPEPVHWVPVWESDAALLIVVHTRRARHRIGCAARCPPGNRVNGCHHRTPGP